MYRLVVVNHILKLAIKRMYEMFLALYTAAAPVQTYIRTHSRWWSDIQWLWVTNQLYVRWQFLW